MSILRVLLALGALFLVGCGKSGGEADADGFTAPTDVTAKVNAQVAEELPLGDQQDFEDAQRGLIASEPDLKIIGPEGTPIWDMPSYDFVQGDAPASANPSLWRHARLNNFHGLFKVSDGIYQLRGYDLSNLSIIEGKTGWIVVDPLTSRETAARAMAFARKHLGDKPVVAVIYTHSHADHFGGVQGLLTAGQAQKQKLRIVAPAGFMEEATSENTLVGPAMSRRSIYMYGRDLPRSPRGHIDTGVGKAVAYGNLGVLEPTDLIARTGQELVLDGVRIVFQNVPSSEAPAEMNLYLPAQKAFLGAEIVTQTMHNLYTLRGAKVRDGLKWAGYIDEALRLFPEAEVYFGSHNWPVWGRERVRDYLEKQRDTYKFIHDQTLHWALQGKTPNEIAEQMKLPEALRKAFASRGYYGTVSHNSKAVYQFYFGWYDANPANLNPLPPETAGRKYVELMGGADEVLKKAQASFDAGEYRWTAQLLNHLVFAEAHNDKAKALLAQTYDQLGYQSESAPWRDVYLTGAYELRHGATKQGVDLALALDMLRHTPVPRFLEAIAVYIKADDAEGKDLSINLVLTDLKQSYALRIKNSVLHFHAGNDPKAGATLNITHELFLKMLVGKGKIRDILMSDDLKVEGSRLDLIRFFALFQKPDTKFNIVTP